jgi:two-component system response regulator AlgR
VSVSPDPLRILIVDDEDLARLRLRALVDACAEPRATVVGEAANAAQAMVWLQQHGQGPDAQTGAAQPACHLVLADIHMPGRDGLRLADELRQLPQSPAVVFVTAHAAHAVQAFDLDAADYLTKPVRLERLQQSLRRVASRLGHTPQPAEPAAAEQPVLVVSERGRVIRVPVAEVLYLKAELKYVTLRTASHTHVLDDALSDLAQRLGARFMRVHRNALVARAAVRALERRALADDDEPGQGEPWAVCVAPVDEWLVVSRRQVAAVREAIEAGSI